MSNYTMVNDTSGISRFSIPGEGGDGAFVTVHDETSEPVVYDLQGFGKSIISFGRNPTNDICIASPYVSGHHGWFRYENGGWVIVDHPNSSNGLLFEGELIEHRILEEGDSFRFEETIGSVLMVFSKNSRSEWESFDLAGLFVITIGRSENCDIRLDHISVSLLHAEIINKNDNFYLRDRSTNGTIVNGKRIRGTHQLREKDLILITNSKLVFSNKKISYYSDRTGFSIDVHNVVKQVESGKIICNGVTLSIQPCEIVAIVGGSGSGKSTVMNCMNGYLSPTGGNVFVNGMDLHENFGTLKNIIGFVPQQDIVHDDLTVFDMLYYSSRLKLPEDASAQECRDTVYRAIDMVELMPHRDTVIRKLSGGQKKRVSIALELLADPNIFFLDEPASGLDPGTEKNLMDTLKNMTKKGKTVVLVTHSTLYLQFCDKIIFMGTGGNLCYYGSYNNALKFFETDNIVDVYDMIYNDPENWKAKYLASLRGKKQKMHAAAETTSSSALAEEKANETSETDFFTNRKWLMQFAVLSKRYAHTILNDKTRNALLWVPPIALGLLISLMGITTFFTRYPTFHKAVIIYFVLICSACLIGIFNTILEICKERKIFKRENMTGLKTSAYIYSKLFVMLPISLIQSLLMLVMIVIILGIPTDGNKYFAFPELMLFITCFLTIFAASALGLAVSAFCKSPVIAMSFASVLMVPQMLFAGAMVPLDNSLMKAMSYLTISRFPLEAYGSIEGLPDRAKKNDREMAYNVVKLQTEKLPKDIKIGIDDRAREKAEDEVVKALMEAKLSQEHRAKNSGLRWADGELREKSKDSYRYESHLFLPLATLCAWIIIYSTLAIFFLRNIASEGDR